MLLRILILNFLKFVLLDEVKEVILFNFYAEAIIDGNALIFLKFID